jgi:hypothetical protein
MELCPSFFLDEVQRYWKRSIHMDYSDPPKAPCSYIHLLESLCYVFVFSRTSLDVYFIKRKKLEVQGAKERLAPAHTHTREQTNQQTNAKEN